MASLALTTLLTILGAGVAAPVLAGSVAYEIKMDTSPPFVQGAGGFIEISTTAVHPPASPTVSSRVFGVQTDGVLGAVLGSAGTATGDLRTADGVTADNTTDYSVLVQSFSVGTYFDAFVTLSGTEIGSGAAGSLSETTLLVSFFDSGANGEIGGWLINPNGRVDGTIFTGTSDPRVQIFVVPEPSGLALLGLGLACIAVASSGRTMRCHF
jgi:hypothetical protein